MAYKEWPAGPCGQIQRSAQKFVCPFCQSVKWSVNKYFNHLESFHQHQAHFRVSCIRPGCNNSYVLVNSLRKHIKRKHAACLLNKNEVNEFNEVNEPLCTGPNESDPFREISDSVSLHDLKSNTKKHLTLLILRLQNQFGLQKAAKNVIVDDIRHIFSYFSTTLTDIIQSTATQQGVSFTLSDNLPQLENDLWFDQIFDSVASDYHLHKYCKEELHLIEPLEIELGQNSKGQKETFQYVPILQVIKNIYSIPDVQNSILKYQTLPKKKDILADFSDGTVFQNHGLFHGDPHLVRIHLYNDEFEVLNPLGPKRGKHKVSAFYFTLGNIEPKYRSQLRNINICVLVRYCHVKKYSYDVILEPLIADLKLLASTGIQVDIDGIPTTLLGGLATISCDNLSAHSLGGFSCSFNTGRICRFCMCLHHEIQYKLTESEHVIRTNEVHNYHLSALENGNPKDTITYGVTSKCTFQKLDYFQTCHAFPPDLMHDFLEGVVPRLLKFMLQDFHKDRLCSLTTFNEELDNFKFGAVDDLSRPVQQKKTILAEASLCGTACQKLCLFRLLPLIIGNYIPQGNVVWLLYLLCREIGDIILSPRIEREWLTHLEYLVHEFLKTFNQVNPQSMTPKFHFILHYSRLISELGPVRQLWCMRYEAKHQYFKKVASKLNNCKNITKSFATKHQLHQCWEQASSDFLQQEASSINGGNEIKFSALTPDIQSTILQFCDVDPAHMEDDETIWKSRGIYVDHMKYCIGTVLVLDLVHEEKVPVFFKITHCLRFRAQWLLCGRIYTCAYFSSHYHGYIVQDSLESIVIAPRQELDHQVMDMYTTENRDNIVILNYLPCAQS